MSRFRLFPLMSSASNTPHRAACLTICALAVLAAALAAVPAHAQPVAKPAAASGASAASSPSASAAPDKVYPPLPTLAMLPPSNGSDDDAPPKPTSRKKGAAAKIKNEMPAPRMVISDTSRSYLNSVEQEIDHAMPK